MNSLTNLDEILENITKTQHPSHIRHILITPSSPSTQKSSDILYLTIGIIAGILLILIIILIAMCILRILQRKKLIGMFPRNPFGIQQLVFVYFSSCEICQWFGILL